MLHLSSLIGQSRICLHTQFVSQVSQLLISLFFHSILNMSLCHQQEQEIKSVLEFLSLLSTILNTNQKYVRAAISYQHCKIYVVKIRCIN